MKQFKHPLYIAIIIAMTLCFIFQITSSSQEIKRVGNTFIEQCDSSKKQRKEPTKTKYTYIDKKGVSYPVYLSSTGKAFIVRVSKKTGKQYRQYLPNVTKQL